MTSVGPLIHRKARWGGLLLLLGSVEFLFVMLFAEAHYPGFSALNTPVSALGGASSPDASAFDASVYALGLMVVFGSFLLAAAFQRRKTRALGIGLLVLSGFATAVTGAIPVSSPPALLSLHDTSAWVALLTAGLAFLVLPLAMLRDTRWEGLRFYTFLTSLVTLVGFLLLVQHWSGALGLGGAERLTLAPGLLWFVVVGVRLSRLPTYQPTPSVPHSSA